MLCLSVQILYTPVTFGAVPTLPSVLRHIYMKTRGARAETATLVLHMQKVNLQFTSKLPVSALVAEF